MKRDAKAESRLAALKAEIKVNPDWMSRFLSVVEYDGENKKALSKIPNTDDLNAVLDTLLEGLSKADADELIVALVKQEWSNVNNDTERGTFMRNKSLFKTAMMHHFKQLLKENPQLRDQYINDPIQFVHNIRLPSHLRVALAEIIKEKAEGKQEFATFAHNIVFSIVCGPMQDSDLQNRSITDSTRILTDSNKMFSQKESAAQSAAATILTSNPNMKPETMLAYAQALDAMMARISPKDYPKGAIVNETRNNIMAFSNHIGMKNAKEQNVVTAAVSGVAQSFARKIVHTLSPEKSKQDTVNFESPKKPPQSWVKKRGVEAVKDEQQVERAAKRQSIGPK